jgi:hypothetical protein
MKTPDRGCINAEINTRSNAIKVDVHQETLCIAPWNVPTRSLKMQNNAAPTKRLETEPYGKSIDISRTIKAHYARTWWCYLPKRPLPTLTAPRPLRWVIDIRAVSAPEGPEGAAAAPAFMGRMTLPHRWPPWSSCGVSMCCVAGLDNIA